jgi:hypothetical protein
MPRVLSEKYIVDRLNSFTDRPFDPIANDAKLSDCGELDKYRLRLFVILLLFSFIVFIMFFVQAN